MAWSTNYVTLLKSHAEEWLTAKSQAATKQKLLTDVAKEIVTYRAEHHPDEGTLVNLEKAGIPSSSQSTVPDQHVQKILTWYQKNAKAEKPQAGKEKAKDTLPKGVKSYNKKYTAKEVAKSHFKTLILDHIANLTDSKPGSPDWLKYYPAAHSAVFNDLSEEQVEECQEIADQWNQVGPTAEKQAK